jgi:hypothetical protein
MPHGSVRKNSSHVHGHILVLTPGHYSSFDNAIIDHHAKTIGAIGVAIYAVLARYANRKTGECWPSLGRLATLLDCARSTIKLSLRKLEACGLITITPRHDEAGDATSHLYTLLDPSPTALDKRRAAHAAAVAAVPEEGRLIADLPPTDCQSTGRLTDGPQPSLPEVNRTNQAGGCSSELSEGTPPKTHTCDHPTDERLHCGETAVCPHCWATFTTPTLPAGVGGPASVKAWQAASPRAA